METLGGCACTTGPRSTLARARIVVRRARLHGRDDHGVGGGGQTAASRIAPEQARSPDFFVLSPEL